MKQRLITIVLLLGCIGLGAVGVLTYKNQDRTAPVITVSDKKMSYTAGDSYDGLLEGVTAKDDRDGDLTDEVFVDKVVPTSKKKAVVYYGVMDKSNNVGTARKTVTYHGDNNMGSDAADITPDTSSTDGTDTTSRKDTADKQAEADKNQESTDQADATTDTLEANGEKPAMSLTATSETITRGSNFTALSVVKDVVDDKDDKDTLYRQLHVDGMYDTTKSGTYELSYYVQDSDGNTSDPITFTLTVQ